MNIELADFQLKAIAVYTLLILEIRELYAFVINNKRRLIDDFRIAMASETAQIKIESNMVLKNQEFPIKLYVCV